MNSKLKSKWSLKEPPYIKKTDKRYNKYVKQIQSRGFCDAETWGLDSVIAEFILPRLIRFKEINPCHPYGLTFEEWTHVIDEMIFAFDWSLTWDDEKYKNLTKEERNANWKRYNGGMKLFAEYFRNLWW